MSFLINTPPTLDGDNAAKILQLYKHLYKMSEEVNYALNALAEGNVVDLTGTTQARQTFATAMTGGSIGGTDAPSLQSYNELKSLIIKTGNAIENSKASIELVLNDEVKRLDGNIGGFQKLIDTLSGKVDGNTTAISDNDASIKKSLADEVAKILGSIDENNSSLEQKISDSATSLQGSINETNESLNNLNTELGKANDAISDQDEKIGGVEEGLLQAQTDISNNASDILDNKTEISGLKEINMELSNAFGVGSEYGSYAEAISNKMSLSAEGVVQKYELVSKLEAADAKAAGFDDWMTITKEHITSGRLYKETVKDPVTGVETEIDRFGVAIGTSIATSIINGEIQQNTTKTDLLATFVSDALIFWQGGQKIAYLSNKKLYILSAEFLGSYIIGKFQWEYTDDLGLVLKFLN